MFLRLFLTHFFTSSITIEFLIISRTGEDDEAINYFVDMLPRIRAKHGHNIKIYEFIQEPGDTVFVPGGWWHGVLNLEDTVAVTQVRPCFSAFDQLSLIILVTHSNILFVVITIKFSTIYHCRYRRCMECAEFLFVHELL